jgi:redox-sensing transcriptional repressor
MKKDAKISNAVIRRLPRYRRYLGELQKKGVDKISSNEFSKLIGYTASQIRQDLNNFGGFGNKGAATMSKTHGEISGIWDQKQIPSGACWCRKSGHAIANHRKLPIGFAVEGIFEVTPKDGQDLDGVPILDYYHG